MNRAIAFRKVMIITAGIFFFSSCNKDSSNPDNSQSVTEEETAQAILKRFQYIETSPVVEVTVLP